MKPLRWGFLGTGNIARRLARTLSTSDAGILQAVGSRTSQRAEEFSREFHAAHAYGSYEDLLADPTVEAIYITTPHPAHAEWAIRAAQAGKHILCEKPATMNLVEARRVASAVRTHGVFFLEAFMYRAHPQTAHIVHLLREGRIGRVEHITCSFCAQVSYDPASRIFDPTLGGGAILDIGCYTMSMARLLAGVALGRDIAEPITLTAQGDLNPREKTDLCTSAHLTFAPGLTAELHTGFDRSAVGVEVRGTDGRLLVPQPWVIEGDSAQISIETKSGREILPTDTSRDLYHHQFEIFARCAQGEPVPHPVMTLEDTLGNMRALDWWRREIGLTYPADIAESSSAT